MRRAPHFSFLSILPPRSPAVCSRVAMSLSISSSGVAGWQMKIRSYSLSSMSSPCTALLLRVLRTRIRRPPVEPVHGLAQSLGDHALDGFYPAFHQLDRRLPFTLR